MSSRGRKQEEVWLWRRRWRNGVRGGTFLSSRYCQVLPAPQDWWKGPPKLWRPGLGVSEVRLDGRHQTHVCGCAEDHNKALEFPSRPVLANELFPNWVEKSFAFWKNTWSCSLCCSGFCVDLQAIKLYWAFSKPPFLFESQLSNSFVFLLSKMFSAMYNTNTHPYIKMITMMIWLWNKEKVFIEVTLVTSTQFTCKPV